MYLQKHGGHRPAELIAAHLERLERERAAGEHERAMLIAAAAAAGAGNVTPQGLLREDQQPEAMEEDACSGEGSGGGGASSGSEQPAELGPDGLPVRRSRRPKVCAEVLRHCVTNERAPLPYTRCSEPDVCRYSMACWQLSGRRPCSNPRPAAGWSPYKHTCETLPHTQATRSLGEGFIGADAVNWALGELRHAAPATEPAGAPCASAWWPRGGGDRWPQAPGQHWGPQAMEEDEGLAGAHAGVGASSSPSQRDAIESVAALLERCSQPRWAGRRLRVFGGKA